MASLILRHKSRSLIPKPNQTLFNSLRFYSSSNNDNDGNNLSSLFTQTKDNQQQQSSTNDPSFAEIRRNLSGFRHQSSDNPLSFEKIRESLAKMRENKVNLGNTNVNEQFSFNQKKESFRTKPSTSMGSSTDNGRAINENLGENDSWRSNLIDSLSHVELGKDNTNKKKGKEGEEESGSFSELQQMIGKFKDIEKVETADDIQLSKDDNDKSKYMGTLSFEKIRESLAKMRENKVNLDKTTEKGKEEEEEEEEEVEWPSLSELQQMIGQFKEIEKVETADDIQLSKDDNDKSEG